MAEIVGLLAAVAQFSIYGIKAYSLVDTATDLGADLADSNLTLEVLNTRLNFWTTKLEASAAVPDGGYKSAIKVLARITTLIVEVKELQAKYKLEHDTTLSHADEDIDPSTFLMGNPDASAEWKRLASVLQKSVSAPKKVRWAAFDKKKLEELLAKLSTFVQHLYDLCPILPAKPLELPDVVSQAGIEFIPPGNGSCQILTNIPFSRNNIFCGRKTIFGKLHEKIWSQKQVSSPRPWGREIITLHGTGGVGKSAIALEYAYKYESWYSSIFWINAGSSDEIVQSALEIVALIIQYYEKHSNPLDYQKIATSLNIHDPILSREELSKAAESSAPAIVKHWLSHESDGRWLVLFDNYDPASMELQTLLPTGHGHVIITSLESAVAHSSYAIAVPEFDSDEGFDFLIKTAGGGDTDLNFSDDEKEYSKKIVNLLGGLPLALNIAGTYIHNSIYLFRDYYMNQLGGDSGSFSSAVWEEGVVAHNNNSATSKHTLNTVWKKSFDRLDKDAAKLLYILSFLGHGDVPIRMVVLGKSKIDCVLGKCSIEKLLQSIALFSLIKIKKTEGSYWISGLFHQWLRNQIPEDAKSENAKLATYMVMSTLVLDGPRTLKDWEYERSIASHIKCCHANFNQYFAPGNNPLDNETKQIACHLAQVYAHFGNNVSDPEKLYRRALAGVKDNPPRPEDLSLMDSLGTNLCSQSKNREAREWYNLALSGREALFGKNAPPTLETVHNLAVLSIREGKYEEALAENMRVLEAQRQDANLGDEHFSTLETRVSIATILKDQCKYDEALEMLSVVLEIRKKSTSDENDLLILDTIHRIGVVYDGQGKYEEARKKYERVLKGQKECLGDDHYKTLDTMHSIAEAYESQGLYKEALKVYEEVREGFQRVFGDNHPWTLAPCNGIAYIFDCLGKYKEALKKYKDLHKRYQQIGAGVRGEFLAENDVGRLLNKMGRYTEALEHHQNAERDQKKALGAEHPLTLASTFGVASVYENQGRYKEAVELFQKILKDEEIVMGRKHSSTLTTVCSMASVLNKQGRPKDALKLYEEVVQGLEEALGKDHPTTLTAVLGESNALVNRRQYESASKSYERVLEGRRQKLGNQHPLTLEASISKAHFYFKQRKYSEALNLYQEAMQGLNSVVGEDHPFTLTAMTGQADVLMKLKKHSEAKRMYEEVKNKRENLDTQSPQVGQCQEKLVNVQRRIDYGVWGGVWNRCLSLKVSMRGKG